MDEEKTQDLEEKGQEVDEQAEEDNLFTATFKEAGAKNQADAQAAEEKAGGKEDKKGDKDAPGKEKDEGAGAAKEGEGKAKEGEGEGEESGPAKKVIENRAKRLNEIMTKAKEKSDEKQVQKREKGKVDSAEEDQEEPETDQDEEPELTEEDLPVKDRRDSAPTLLKGVKLSEKEQEFIEDMPESISIIEKVVKNVLKSAGKDPASKDIRSIIDAQSEEIATLRTEIVISKLVPDYEEIIFAENQLDENGEKVPNPEFWGWLDKQPDLVKALAKSYNPKDNAAVLNYYKEDLAKKSVSGKDQRDRESLKKVQELHGFTPTARKAVKRSGGEPGEDDFDAHFQIASKKGRK